MSINVRLSRVLKWVFCTLFKPFNTVASLQQTQASDGIWSNDSKQQWSITKHSGVKFYVAASQKPPPLLLSLNYFGICQAVDRETVQCD